MPQKAGDGNKVIAYFREFGATTAWKMLFQTEIENAPTRDRESTPTKDGGVSSSASLEDEVTVTGIRSYDFDQHIRFKLSVRDDINYELWIVYMEKSKTGSDGTTKEYFAEYRQGYITEYSGTDGAEDNPEVELTYLPEGKYQINYTPIPAQDEAMLNYVFQRMDGTAASNATEEDKEKANKPIEDYFTSTSDSTTDGTTETTPEA